MDATTLYLIFIPCVLIDLIITTIMPKFYTVIGIPIAIRKFTAADSRVLPLKKGMLISGHGQFKFFDDGTDIWFRTKFNIGILYSLAFLSITKGIIRKKDSEIHCYHVINLTTVLAIVLFALLPLYYPIDTIGMVFLVILAAGLLAVTFFRNGQFTSMIDTLYPEKDYPRTIPDIRGQKPE
jgi:hypothetical protein